MNDNELHWLALRMVPGLGARGAGRLLERFRTPQQIFRASLTELECAGVSGSVAQSIASGCSFEAAAGQAELTAQHQAAVIPLDDPRYPARLRTIFDPPVLLFVRGDAARLNDASVAVVGTRRPTAYGVNVAERFGADLAAAGIVVTSGMARGIDASAHKGALKGASPFVTIAVLGCGVDVVYPSENRQLAGQIVERGAIVSEFPMGSTAFPQNFPVRNRVIAGMSLGVCVVEGAQYSGSAITARLAMEQGRLVFAVPGSILSKASWGPNLLIKDGATLTQDTNDILNALPADVRVSMAARQPALPVEAAPGIGRWLMTKLAADVPVALDALVEALDGFSQSELIAGLFELELSGAVRQLPGRQFVKVW